METIDCKKHPLGPQELEELLRESSKVLISKGKKLLELDPKKDWDEIMSQAIGRSGNLRAPSIRQGGLLMVGFHQEGYQRLIS